VFILKKILSLLVIATLIFSMTPSVFATTTINAAGNPNNTAASIADDVNFADAGTLTITGVAVSIATGATPAGATEVVTDAVTATTTANGIITYSAAHTGASSIFGRIGIAGSNEILTLNLDGTGSLTLYGDAGINNGVIFSANSTLNLISGVDLTSTGSAVSNDSLAATGTFNLLGGTSTITGTVGAAGAGAISTVSAGVNGSTSSFSASVFATNFNLAGSGTVNLNGTSTITTTTIAAAGVLNLGTNADLTGAVVMNGAGSITLANTADISGAITTSVDNQGTLTLSGASTLGGAIGANGFSLGDVNAGASGTSTFNGDIFATNLDITGTGTVNIDSLTGNLRYQGDGFVSIDTGEDITGIVSNSTGVVAGTLTLEGATNVSLQVGGAGVLSLLDVNAGASGTSTFSGDIFATNLDITGTGTVNIDSLTGNLRYQGAGFVSIDTGEDITGIVSNSTGVVAGTLTLEGATNVSLQVGGAGVLSLLDVNAGASGTSTFSGDIFATNLDITGTGRANIAALTGNLRYQGDGVVSVDTLKSITGTVTTTTTGTGKLILEGTSTVAGQVGTNALRLKEIEMDLALATATFSSDVFAVTTTVANTVTANFNGNVTSNINFTAAGFVNLAASKTITGTVTTAVDGAGTLNFAGTSTTGGNIGVATTGDLLAVNVNGGTLSLAHNIVAITTTINNAAHLAPTADRTVTGNLTMAGTSALDLGANTLTVNGAGVYTQGANTTLNLSINSVSVFGRIMALENNAAVSALSTINLTILDSYIPSGSAFKIIDSAGGAGVFVPGTITDNSYTLNFTGAGAGGDLTLTALRANPYATASTDANNSAVGQALEEAGQTSTDSDMQHVLSVLDNLSSAKEVSDALETMHPDVSSGALQGTGALNNQFHAAIGNRLSYTRGGFSGQQTGIASGDMFQGAGMWMQGLGSHSKQGARNGIEGYDANAFGTTVGFDKALGNHFRAGIAAGYGHAAVDSHTPGNPNTTVNSFQGTLYGSYESARFLDARKKRETMEANAPSQEARLWYMDGVLSFMQSKYDSKREITFGEEARIARADHYGQEISTKFETGYAFTFEKTKALEVTPFASLGYNYLRMNQYKETGADSLNLNVQGEGFHQLQQGLGLKLGYPIVFKKAGTFIPSIKTSYLYDYISSRFDTTASFQGGGSAFKTSGAEPARNAFVLGTELAFLNRGHLTITGNFDLELRDTYESYTYYLTLRYDF